MSKSPAPRSFMSGLAWALFGVTAFLLLVTVAVIGGIFPLARIGVLPLWSTLGILIGGAGVLGLLHLLVQQKQALQIASANLQ